MNIFSRLGMYCVLGEHIVSISGKHFIMAQITTSQSEKKHSFPWVRPLFWSIPPKKKRERKNKFYRRTQKPETTAGSYGKGARKRIKRFGEELSLDTKGFWEGGEPSKRPGTRRECFRVMIRKDFDRRNHLLHQSIFFFKQHVPIKPLLFIEEDLQGLQED